MKSLWIEIGIESACKPESNHDISVNTHTALMFVLYSKISKTVEKEQDFQSRNHQFVNKPFKLYWFDKKDLTQKNDFFPENGHRCFLEHNVGLHVDPFYDNFIVQWKEQPEQRTANVTSASKRGLNVLMWTIPLRACKEEVTSIKLFWLRFSVSVCGGEPRSRVGRAAFPAGRARLRSWPWTACTSCTGPGVTHPRSASRATGGTALGTGRALLVDYCGGTSCTGARPRRPSL